ncbi:MAG: DUF1841 family protein [Pseudomonadota bacterium]
MLQQNRSDYREVFFSVWKKIQNQQTISDAMENIIAQIIKQHPEYHKTLSDYDKFIEKDYLPEMGDSNPFMHMSMHIAITEQLMTDQPVGIKSIYQKLCTKLANNHDAEHFIMECLGNMIWKSQKEQVMPDMDDYLRCIKTKL